MLRLILLCLAIFAIFEHGGCNRCCLHEGQSTDYYWKDFMGTVDEDAIAGGRNVAGKTTYIGQIVSKPYGLLPATIIEGLLKAEASSGVVVTSDKFVKILCAENPKSYKWITTDTNTAHLLGATYHLVAGGTDSTNIYYIGRAYHEGNIIIGKINLYSTGVKGLTIPHNNREFKYDTFEMLVYNESLNPKPTLPPNPTPPPTKPTTPPTPKPTTSNPGTTVH